MTGHDVEMNSYRDRGTQGAPGAGDRRLTIGHGAEMSRGCLIIQKAAEQPQMMRIRGYVRRSCVHLDLLMEVAAEAVEFLYSEMNS